MKTQMSLCTLSDPHPWVGLASFMNVKETEMYRELQQSPSVHKPKPLTLMDHQTKQ